MKKIIFFIIVLSCFNPLALAGSDSSIQGDVSLSYDDNLNRSPYEPVAIDSAFATASIGYDHNHRINSFSFIDYRVQLKYESYQDADGLNNAQASAGISYKFKPSAGFTRATYILKMDIRVADFATDIRDRTAYEAAAIMSFWVTNKFSMRSGLNARMHDSDSRAFDTTDYRLFINADLQLSRRATLYSTLNFITGDLVSTVPLANAGDYILDIVRQADEIEFDPTFGDNMVAYKVDTDIVAFTLGYNHVIGNKQSLDISARYAVGQADYDVEYKATFFNISYLFAFAL